MYGTRSDVFPLHRLDNLWPSLEFMAHLLPPETVSTKTTYTMVGGRTGESYQERSKGKDVRTSNIVAAKVRTKVETRSMVSLNKRLDVKISSKEAS